MTAHYYEAFAIASLCLSANSLIFRRYMRKESDFHLNLNFMSSVLMFCECNKTHAPTLIECDVNPFNSVELLILYTLLAASCNIFLMWISLI